MWLPVERNVSFNEDLKNESSNTSTSSKTEENNYQEFTEYNFEPQCELRQGGVTDTCDSEKQAHVNSDTETTD